MKQESEIIDLASEGYFYPPDHPLSTGKIKIFPMTAKHEEMLANQNLIKRNLLERHFLNSIVDGEFNYDDLLACDRDSIILNLRVVNYGGSTKTKFRCEECEKDFETDVSFILRPNPFDFTGKTRGKNELRYRFIKTNKELIYKLPTAIEYDLYEKRGWLAFLKAITLSIESVSNINDFYDNRLPATDSMAFRLFFDKNTPGYQTQTILSCPTCNQKRKLKVELNTTIFGIQPESKINIHSEIFDLCYYSNGAFTQEGVYNMPTFLRNFYIKKLVEAKKAEADAHNKSAASKPSSLARPPTVKK